ncbi:uncharacterized protein BDZ99DRAFT_568011 [Mytilinidion resinicola]|uniref:Ubiquitin-like domain-containing protein n=1 Tax=Mytilinidion resinicola TaxID=574789 RepID=A0A6A6YZW8_9PEZI|nr:uncharacterized protein BDZ99DRAFT_568011 [Mytilinidion resinicola]KAF2814381.1 hypothetical protein BDZ99DRAFT_568011 [Mytilinidion resinicola]
MPITFGSVGDIISVSLLVKDLLLALNDSRGSAAEYQAVVRELYILDTALLQVVQLSRSHRATPELQALCETASRTVEKCRVSVDGFTKRIRKFNSSLSATGSGSAVKHAARKIQWHISRKDEVVRFRTELSAYTNSMNMLLATANVTLLKVTNDHLDSQITASGHRIQSSLENQDEVLEEVRARLEDNDQLITAGNTLAGTMSERLEWIKNLGSDLKIFMTRLIAGNLAIFREVVAIRKSLTALHRPLSEDPFILEDALGRVAPVHLRFITSWEAFDAVLEIRFKGLKGYSQVRRKQFVIQEQSTRREIDRTSLWEGAFFSGQRVDMSLIFQSDTKEADNKKLVSCPNCHSISSQPTGEEVQCSTCSVWYRRVTEINDVEPPSHSLPRPWKLPAQFGAPAFGPTAPPSKKKRARDGVIIEEDRETAGIKRIRMIDRHLRIKFAGGFSAHAHSGAPFEPKKSTPVKPESRPPQPVPPDLMGGRKWHELASVSVFCTGPLAPPQKKNEEAMKNDEYEDEDVDAHKDEDVDMQEDEDINKKENSLWPDAMLRQFFKYDALSNGDSQEEKNTSGRADDIESVPLTVSEDEVRPIPSISEEYWDQAEPIGRQNIGGIVRCMYVPPKQIDEYFGSSPFAPPSFAVEVSSDSGSDDGFVRSHWAPPGSVESQNKDFLIAWVVTGNSLGPKPRASWPDFEYPEPGLEDQRVVLVENFWVEHQKLARTLQYAHVGIDSIPSDERPLFEERLRSGTQLMLDFRIMLGNSGEWVWGVRTLCASGRMHPVQIDGDDNMILLFTCFHPDVGMERMHRLLDDTNKWVKSFEESFNHTPGKPTQSIRDRTRPRGQCRDDDSCHSGSDYPSPEIQILDDEPHHEEETDPEPDEPMHDSARLTGHLLGKSQNDQSDLKKRNLDYGEENKTTHEVGESYLDAPIPKKPKLDSHLGKRKLEQDDENGTEVQHIEPQYDSSHLKKRKVEQDVDDGTDHSKSKSRIRNISEWDDETRERKRIGEHIGEHVEEHIQDDVENHVEESLHAE